jgi:hypothetical protein
MVRILYLEAPFHCGRSTPFLDISLDQAIQTRHRFLVMASLLLDINTAVHSVPVCNSCFAGLDE